MDSGCNSMITHIFGSNSFWISQEVEKIHPSHIFHADQEDELRRFVEMTSSQNLFNDYESMALIELTSTRKNSKPNKNVEKLLSKLEKKSIFARPLEGRALYDWVRNYLKERGFSIETSAIDFIVKLDEWQMKNELDKLMNYCFEKNNITISDVMASISDSDKLNIFDFADAVASKRKTLALSHLQDHIEAGTDHFDLHRILVFQFRSILTIKSGGTIKAHPFVIRKSTELAKKYELSEITKLFLDLHQAELDAKRGKALMHESLFLFICKSIYT